MEEKEESGEIKEKESEKEEGVKKEGVVFKSKKGKTVGLRKISL